MFRPTSPAPHGTGGCSNPAAGTRNTTGNATRAPKGPSLRPLVKPGSDVHVAVLAGGRVQALAFLHGADLLDHDTALEAGVRGDLLDGLLERAAHDLRAGCLVALEVDLVERRLGVQQGHAAAGHDALLDRSLGRLPGVLAPLLLLLELDLGGRADLDHRDAAGELRQPLLQLLAVVVGVGLLDLRLDLVDAAGDILALARALDDRRLVLR